MASFWATSAARTFAKTKHVYGGALLATTTAFVTSNDHTDSSFLSASRNSFTKCEYEDVKKRHDKKKAGKVNLKTRVSATEDFF